MGEVYRTYDLILNQAVAPWEMVNAMAVAVRRKGSNKQEAADFLVLLTNFDFRIENPPEIGDLATLSRLAAVHQFTAYDVAYLDLAMRLAVPLATQDDALKRATLAEGVNLL